MPFSSGRTRTKFKAAVDDDRTGIKVETLKQAILENLRYVMGKDPEFATDMDYFMAVAYTVRDRILARWLETRRSYSEHNVRLVCYLSAEFLMGPHLANNLLNLGVEEPIRQATKELGLDLDRIIAEESEPGLGNGGLGRLAACYLDSWRPWEYPPSVTVFVTNSGCSTRRSMTAGKWSLPTTGFGMAIPGKSGGPMCAVDVLYGGHTEYSHDARGNLKVAWIPASVVKGIPYDTPILGYGSGRANDLRLWKSESGESFYFDKFNSGDYQGAVASKNFAENITKVLYPNDDEIQGKQLRLEQQYFFVSCALQDMIRIHLRGGHALDKFHEKWTIQLNDTHPSIGVAELMRLLIDQHELGWDQAWEITSQTFNYTNHTLLPEALERWPLPLFAGLLPRHLEIIYEINSRFLQVVRDRFPGDEGKVIRLSIIDETGSKFVRMAHLACVGSKHINGVAELHTELLKAELLRDFHDLWPGKFTNVTNGVTPRRWLAVSNPEQSELMTSKIGDSWISNLEQLKKLELMQRIPLSARSGGSATRRQGTACPVHPRGHGPHGRSQFHVRHTSETHTRIQASTLERALYPHALSSTKEKSLAGYNTTYLPLWWQGRRRIRDGQVDHQADQFHRRSDQPGPGGEAPHQGTIPTRLQRYVRAKGLSCSGPQRTDFDRRQRGLGHGKHEIRHERGAHDRNP